MSAPILNSKPALNDNAPIVMFTYNRLAHTRRTIEALLQNDLAADSELILYSDAAKDPAGAPAVNAVRSYLATISGFKSVTIIEREQNFGLAKSVIDGVTSVCDRYGKVIVMEDDLVTSRFFLRYMNDGLLAYANDDRVISIHGYIYPVTELLPETFFLRGADCWGWATWKRGWDYFDPDSQKLLAALVEKKLEREFNLNNSNDYMRLLRDQIEGKVNSWAIRWHASAFLADKLTLYPGVSLVQNIGMDSSGTHCGEMPGFGVSLSDRPIRLQNMPIMENESARKAIEHFYFSIKIPFGQRILNKLRSMAKRITG